MGNRNTLRVLATLTVALALALGAGAASAAPIYAIGNECPTDAQVGGFTRQYYVSPSVACVYDASDPNIQGTNAEALALLTNGPAFWGDGWVGLGEEPLGFTYTADAGNDDGTFTIGGLLDNIYGQFALGIKDGADPQWAIFLLSVGQTTGNWGFRTNGGDLSHFVLYGRVIPSSDDPPPDDDPPPVPEPASLLLLGMGFASALLSRRR